MNHVESICHTFAKTFKAKGIYKDGICSVTLNRTLSVAIEDRPSPTLWPITISFEALDQYGIALNSGEVAVLKTEMPIFIQALTRQDITVNTRHDNWLTTTPSIMYIHFQSVESPIIFATKVAAAYRTLTSYPVSE